MKQNRSLRKAIRDAYAITPAWKATLDALLLRILQMLQNYNHKEGT